ncbi:MAG: DUF115 domain-containing protein [Treponema sp.]|jgi:hypothetical protein|nr:DUF115 domain-containing protein [Treponema sp.]
MTDISLVKKNYPNLIQELDKKDDDELGSGDIIVERTSFGFPVLKIKGLYIHSPRDPVKESQRQVESVLSLDTNQPQIQNCPIIILGFGLGYVAEAVALKAPGRPIIIVEKRKELLRLALELRDIAPLLLNNRIAFVLGRTEGIGAALSLFEAAGKPLIIKNRNLITLDEAWYKEAENAVYSWKSRNDVNRATLKRFGRRWVKNLSRNLAAIRDLPGISRLKDILKGKDIPVFLAAAGPSLDKSRAIIPELAKRCVVVAVDTSLRFVLGTGIDPDFTVSLDPQYWNFRHLDCAPAPKTMLIAESAVYPACLRHTFKGIFLCGSQFPLGRFIEDKVDPKGEVGAGGSVATAAWDFARILGASSVWIAGLDLSFPGYKTHFKGALFEEKSHAQSFRFAPAETWSIKALRDGNHFTAKSAARGSVLTDQRLSLYAAWFENRFSMYPKIRNISLSGEGLAIKALEIGQEEELLALPERRNEINSLLDRAFSIENDEATPKKYEESVKTLLAGLKDIKDTAEEAAILAETWCRRFKNGHSDTGDEEKVLKKLDKANQIITNSAVKEVAGFLFPDLSEAEKNPNTDATPIVRHLDYSQFFYKALAESAEYNLNLLKSAN